jgi:F-type H+-transporting ATPase subunit a
VVIDPMHQFKIHAWVPIHIPVGAGRVLDISFTNASFWMILAAVIITGGMTLAVSGSALVPGRMQSIAEISYQFVANMVRDTVGTDGMRYFPFIFAIFSFVLVCNMLGLFPYWGYTATSQIIVTAALAFGIFTAVILLGISKHGFGFLRLFVPSGVPWWLMPLIVPIEIFSFLTRPVSHSVRLFANMLAGHIMLKVFAGFIIMLSALGIAGIVGGILPMAFTVAVTALEALVGFLQAYVFAILASIYLHDALHPGH